MAWIDEASKRRGQVGGEFAEGVDEILGQVRARGVPAVAGQTDDDGVAGCGDGADARSDFADVDVRVAVDGVDLGHVVEDALGDHAQRTTGGDFLARLEDQTHASAESAGT